MRERDDNQEDHKQKTFRACFCHSGLAGCTIIAIPVSSTGRALNLLIVILNLFQGPYKRNILKIRDSEINSE